MPKFTEKQIKGKIGDGSISGISVDTAIFDSYGCHLDHPVLARLDQFKRGGVKLILSEIVVREISAHISRDAAETQRTLKTALKNHSRRWKLGKNLDELKAVADIDVKAIDAASEQVEEYIESIGADVVPAGGNGDLAAEVFRRYFEVITPFGAREIKKHEFPDAFALLSLEQAAAKLQTLILCVSPDKGWAAFAEESRYLVVVPKLGLALSWFNDPGRNIAEKAVAIWKATSAPDLVTEVESAFERYVDGLSFDVEATAPLDYEYQAVSAALQYIYTDKIESPVVVAENDDQVTFTLNVIAKIGFEVEFNFYAHDSIDGDNVGLGSESSYREQDLPFEVTITVAREMDGGQFDVLDVNVTSRRIVVDFGYVDPFPNEDPTHEKY